MDGEASAVAMATALGISSTRVHQLWKDGMPRTSVLLAKDWRAERLEQSSANPERAVDFSVSAGGEGVGVNVAGENSDFASTCLFSSHIFVADCR